MDAPQPPISTLTPAQTDSEIIDYTYSKGKKLYALVTMKLSIPLMAIQFGNPLGIHPATSTLAC